MNYSNKDKQVYVYQMYLEMRTVTHTLPVGI